MLQFESGARVAYNERDAPIFERRVRETAQQANLPAEPVESTWREWSITLRAKAEACHFAHVYWAWKPENDPHPPIDRSRIFIRYWALIVENMFDMLPTVMTMHYSAALDALRHFDVRANLLMRRLWQLPKPGLAGFDEWPDNLPAIPYPSKLDVDQPAISGLTTRTLAEERQLLVAEYQEGNQQIQKDATEQATEARPAPEKLDPREALMREYKAQAAQALKAYRDAHMSSWDREHAAAMMQPSTSAASQAAPTSSRAPDRPSTSGSRRPASSKKQPFDKRQRK